MIRTAQYAVLITFLGVGLASGCIDAEERQRITLYRKHGRFENVRPGTPTYNKVKDLLWNHWLHKRPAWIEVDFLNMHGEVSRTTYILSKDRTSGRLLLRQCRVVGNHVREVVWDRVERVVPGFRSKEKIPAGTDVDPDHYSLRLVDSKYDKDTYLQ